MSKRLENEVKAKKRRARMTQDEDSDDPISTWRR